MALGVDGLRLRIAAALGLCPLLLGGAAGCVARAIDDADDAGDDGESGESTGASSASAEGSTGETPPVPTTTIATTVSGSDDGTEDTGLPPTQTCWPVGHYLEWELWRTPGPTGECACDEECQVQAIDQWYAENCCDSCWYVFGSVQCVEYLEGSCHFIVTMAEDGCGEGRPLLIEGRARTAGACERDDWGRADATPWVEGLSPLQRRMLADRWSRSALAEHASVASFARFVLDLLALGAPPELVAEATAAMHDEIRHAEVAFALASAYAGHPVGPGPLPMHGLVAGSDAEAIVRAAVREGCVEETLAAAEAELAAHRATDPAVRAALLVIAEDEARHAVLAWRFVDWAVRREPSLGAVVRQELRLAIERADARDDEPEASIDAATVEDEDVAAAHGVLPPALRQQLRARCLRGTIRPCAAAMLHGRWGSDAASPPS